MFELIKRKNKLRFQPFSVVIFVVMRQMHRTLSSSCFYITSYFPYPNSKFKQVTDEYVSFSDKLDIYLPLMIFLM